MEDVPDNIIPVQEADNLYKTYGDDRAPIIERNVNDQYRGQDPPYEATRFVTADYEKMKAYMAFIEKESKEAGVTPEGLRIYFGAAEPTKGKPGKETIFFNPVATFKGIDGDISYAIHTDSKGNKKAITVGDVIDGKIPKTSNTDLLYGGVQSLAGNTVTFPPPPHPNDPNDYH